MSVAIAHRLEREARRLDRIVADPDTPEDRREAAYARLAEIDGMRWTPTDTTDRYHFASL